MEQMQCKSCGAHLKMRRPGEWICEYCGAVYKTDDSIPNEIRIIEVQPANAQTVRAYVKLPHEMKKYMGEVEMTEHVVQNLAHKMAEALATYMRLDVSEDMSNPFQSATIVRGTLRILPPDFRF